MIRQILGALVAIVVCCKADWPQSVETRFEAVSIKAAPPYDIGADHGIRGGPGTNDPGQITYPMINVISLLATAYGVEQDQIIGPDSIREPSYSIAAKIPPSTSKERFNMMLRSLLADRFHLVLHHETRSFPAYALVIASGGLKIVPSPPDAKTPQPEGDDYIGRPLQAGKDGYPVLWPSHSQLILYYDRIARGTFRITMAEFAPLLGNYVRMASGGAKPRISDRTGLTGKYDFKLEFSMDSSLSQAQPGSESEDAQSRLESPFHAQNIFSALEKQLGLKMEKGAKVDLDVLVVDHVDKTPTAN